MILVIIVLYLYFNNQPFKERKNNTYNEAGCTNTPKNNPQISQKIRGDIDQILAMQD